MFGYLGKTNQDTKQALRIQELTGAVKIAALSTSAVFFTRFLVQYCLYAQV